MFKKIRNAIRDGAAYALGVSDSQMNDNVDRLFNENPANHILHGIFEPLFARYIALITRNNSAQRELISLIDKLSKSTTQESNPTYRSICFNMTINSILLYYPVLEKRGGFTSKRLHEYIEREWDYFNDKIGLGGHKSEVESLLTTNRERKLFAEFSGLTDTGLAGIYKPTSKIGAFAVGARKPYYYFGGQAKTPELIQIWRWIFGPNEDSQYERHVQCLEETYLAFHKNTLSIMRGEKETNNTEHQGKKENTQEHYNKYFVHFPCPSCDVKMRLTLPINTSKGRCGKCKSMFVIKGNDSGKIWLEAFKPEHNKESDSDASSASSSITNALSLLGLQMGATESEIKLAYRKKISEYHPDKTHGLGAKIQKIALEETQNLNNAVELLKRSGLL